MRESVVGEADPGMTTVCASFNCERCADTDCNCKCHAATKTMAMKQAAFNARQEERRERYERRAELALRVSQIRQARAREMASVIPFGQPILVGHHSEGRDRRYRAKIENNFRKGFELQKKAEYYRSKAASIGTAGISSDDPSAVEQLQAKIDKAEKWQALMVATNKAVRKNDRVALAALGFNETRITDLFTPDFCGRIGFADFELTNNSANIRRMKQRIEGLRRESARRTEDGSSALKIAAPEGVTIEENADINRLQIRFPGIPAADVRARLKSSGFRWSPSERAWQRQLNESARWAAKRALEVSTC